MLGRELKNDATNVFVNYAVPAESVAGTLRAMLDGSFAPEPTSAAEVVGGPTPADLGFALVPDVVRRTPAYVEYVAEESPAAAAGLRAGDLVVLLDGDLTPSVRALIERLRAAEPGSIGRTGRPAGGGTGPAVRGTARRRRPPRPAPPHVRPPLADRR